MISFPDLLKLTRKFKQKKSLNMRSENHVCKSQVTPMKPTKSDPGRYFYTALLRAPNSRLPSLPVLCGIRESHVKDEDDAFREILSA